MPVLNWDKSHLETCPKAMKMNADTQMIDEQQEAGTIEDAESEKSEEETIKIEILTKLDRSKEKNEEVETGISKESDVVNDDGSREKNEKR